MAYLNKLVGYFKKVKEYLTSEGPIQSPWYTISNRADYRSGWENELADVDGMKQYTGGRYPGIPDFYGPEVKLPPELREKMTVHRNSSTAQTDVNYNHPEYCVCPSCNRKKKETLKKEMLVSGPVTKDPRFLGIDLSSDYYGAGSKTNNLIPYYGPAGVPTNLPKYGELKI
jgi:hypothetical protein